MPRVVRNFFLDGKIDGRETRISTGPQGSDGGFELVITIREDGRISDKRVEIMGGVMYNGDLVLDVVAVDGDTGRCVYHEEVTP